ncbi:hypothetical protein ROZALSC1DRAFT_26115, partial [Rozella allomycis CSF55]
VREMEKIFSSQDTLSKNDPPGKFDNSKVEDSMIIDDFNTSENSNEVATTTFDHVAQNAPSTVPSSLEDPVSIDSVIASLLEKFRAAKRTPKAFETLEQETFHKFKDQLRCHCTSPVTNNGRGGDLNQFGVGLIQTACKNKACRARNRLNKILEENGLAQIANILKETMQTIVKEKEAKSGNQPVQKKITEAF